MESICSNDCIFLKLTLVFFILNDLALTYKRGDIIQDFKINNFIFTVRVCQSQSPFMVSAGFLSLEEKNILYFKP